MDMDQDQSDHEFGCLPGMVLMVSLSLAAWYGAYCLAHAACQG